MTAIVYLCGGINGLSDADAKDWREFAKQRLHALGIQTLDPMRRDYRGKEAANVNEIVHGDLVDIDSSSLILAMCPKPSWGTAMEIFYAHSQGKPVYSVVPSLVGVSPWLLFHSKRLCLSLDNAIDHIEALLT